MLPFTFCTISSLITYNFQYRLPKCIPIDVMNDVTDFSLKQIVMGTNASYSEIKVFMIPSFKRSELERLLMRVYVHVDFQGAVVVTHETHTIVRSLNVCFVYCNIYRVFYEINVIQHTLSMGKARLIKNEFSSLSATTLFWEDWIMQICVKTAFLQYNVLFHSQ